jgi:hypothetical protein
MSSDIIWMPVTRLQSRDLMALKPKYLFDWDRKVWVEHQDDVYDGRRWHTMFLCREIEGKSQFWLEVVPTTAKLLTEFGLRNEHILRAIEPMPPWTAKVVMFYMDTQIAAALVEHQPKKNVPPLWWFQEPPPTRFEREDVI